MKSARMLMALFATAIVAVPLIAAVATADCPGRGMPKYDPATEITLKGTVEELAQVEGCCPGGGTGTHLTLKSDATSLEIHLGPSSFLAERKFELAKGDVIEITGSKVKCMGEDVLLAREVKKGDKVLTLRNKQGVPEWSGGRGKNATS